MTFRLPNAGTESIIQAAAQALWIWTLAAITVCWSVTVTTDFFAAKIAGVRSLGRKRRFWHIALPSLASALSILGATHESGQAYVPPSIWPQVVGVAAAAYVVAALLHVLAARPTATRRTSMVIPHVIVSGLAIAVLAVAWFGPSTYSGPSTPQLGADLQVLKQAVPMRNCKPVSVASDPVLIMRDMVRASVLCAQGDMSGRFIWFRSSGVMNVYASARANESDVTFSAESCTADSSFLGNWHEDADPSQALGPLMCVRMSHANLIAWGNNELDIYCVVRAQGPMSKLYRWWIHHNHIGLSAS